MRKIWTIFKHEYTRHVLRKRFLVALLSLPIWLGVMAVAGVASVLLQLSFDPVGYVDPTGLLANTGKRSLNSTPEVMMITFQAYSSESEAQSALDAGKIQAYLVLPEDYPTNHTVRLVYHGEAPSGIVISEFRDLLRIALLEEQPPEIARRILDGPDLVVQAAQDAREAELNHWFRAAVPFVAGIFLIISIFTSAGYLLQAVVEEKENRTMEILATSVSPGQIMTGKIAGLICVGWTQVFVWMAFPVAGILVLQAYTPLLDGMQIDWSILWLAAAVAIPTFVLISALMAAIGASVTEAREGQQVMTLVTLPVMAPFMLVSAIIANPGGFVALALTFFPLTAGVTLLMRVGFASVPAWQVAASVLIQVLSAAGALWLAARIFRLGMLRYGQRMSLKEILRAAVPGKLRQPEA
jgi:ABC-2 type transport system permease protein